MALVAAKCTECGASIKIDNSKEIGVCQHCGTTFITEKAINNYKVNYSVTNIITNAKEQADDYLNNGIVFYNLCEWDKSLQMLNKANSIDASNHKTWYYIALCFYQKQKNTERDFSSDIYVAIDHAVKIADTSEKKKEIKEGLLEIIEYKKEEKEKNYIAAKEQYDIRKNEIDKNKQLCIQKEEQKRKTKKTEYTLIFIEVILFIFAFSAIFFTDSIFIIFGLFLMAFVVTAMASSLERSVKEQGRQIESFSKDCIFTDEVPLKEKCDYWEKEIEKIQEEIEKISRW